VYVSPPSVNGSLIIAIIEAINIAGVKNGVYGIEGEGSKRHNKGELDTKLPRPKVIIH
jgi:hypothetical protein